MARSPTPMPVDRGTEWFVPKFGPRRFRLAVGLLFLPYTGMVLAYTVIGSMLAHQVLWERVGAIVVAYFFALGVGAHALDAVGSGDSRPWGEVWTRRQLWVLAIGSLVIAYAIGGYYMLTATPLLWLIAIPEGFFVFAYNLEWWRGRFHTDGWFALSWGTLPVLAGYILQTNCITTASVVVAAAMGLLSYVEITVSRPYKALKRVPDGLLDDARRTEMARGERILKSLSLGVILLGVGMMLWRLTP